MNPFSESFADAWRARFGQDSPSHAGSYDLEAVDRLLTHRSVRRYSDEPIPEAVLATLVAAGQSAATSSNLQSWSVISVDDPARRAEIAALCSNQKQVLTAARFLVFIADLHRVEQFTQAEGLPMDGLETVEMYTVAVVDAALAAERVVCAAEALGYGICYIGAMRNKPHEVAELLGLPSRTFAVFGLCLGRPAENANAAIKPRMLPNGVWFKETYGVNEEAIEEYNERYAAFAAEQNIPMDGPWSLKSAQRAQPAGLAGREALAEFLHSQGLAKR